MTGAVPPSPLLTGQAGFAPLLLSDAAGASIFAGLGESLAMALRALRANVFRTVLTLLGIIIGVSSVVAMLAIGEGAKDRMIAQIGQMGTNLLIVRPQFRNGHGYNGAIATLNADDALEIAKLPYVSSALPVSNSDVTVRFNDIDYQTQVTATTDALPRTRSWPVERGIFFDAEDQASFATVAVLGQTVAGVLFPDDADPIGQYILINNVPFQVIGVMTPKGDSANGNDSDDVIFVPLTTGMLRVSGQNFIRSITVAVSDLSQMSFVQATVTKLLTARHNGAEDFQIRNLADVVQTASAEQDTMTLLLGSVAAISLLVGGIGIMNIMLVSVVERTREIGIRMATGARRRDIMQQFLAEAIGGWGSGIGGIAGVLGRGRRRGFVIRAFDTPTSYTAGPMLLALGCAVTIGLVFGYAPARKAARLDPVLASWRAIRRRPQPRFPIQRSRLSERAATAAVRPSPPSPSCSTLSILSTPPCRAASARTSARPRPVPSREHIGSLEACSKAWPMRDNASAGMPMPVSRTTICAQPASKRALRFTSPPLRR